MISQSKPSSTPTPLEQAKPVDIARHTFSIGLPRCLDAAERRFPLTPEATEQLTRQGFIIHMETSAAQCINYTDAAYSRAGAVICSRADALACDIVLHLAPLPPTDILRMRRGAMLLTLLSAARLNRESVIELLHRGIISIALNLFEDRDGHTPFADILAEIEGRAAITRASALLADADHGKGILLGGVAGVMPCEIAIIGSGLAACAAAHSATGLGAMVRMLDHDVYRLRNASTRLGAGIIATSLHPRALHTALHTADILIYTDIQPAQIIDHQYIDDMKRGVVIFDLSDNPGKAFPSLPTVDLVQSHPVDIDPDKPSRVCYVNAANLVPRTAAMALSDAFITMMQSIITAEGVTNALRLLPGFRSAACTFLGKPVNPEVAAIAGQRPVDINLYLSLS